MGIALLLLFKRSPDSGVFDLLYGGTGLALITVWTLWDRVYRKKWHEYRSCDWTRVEGQFDEGEVITMRKARSKTISGYEVWLGYEYHVDGKRDGLFRLSERSEDEANSALTALTNKRVIIRVDPHNPKRSIVSEKELRKQIPFGNDKQSD